MKTKIAIGVSVFTLLTGGLAIAAVYYLAGIAAFLITVFS